MPAFREFSFHNFPFGAENSVSDAELLSSVSRSRVYISRDAHLSIVRCTHTDAMSLDMRESRHIHPHIPINACSSVPTGLLFAIDMHDKSVLSLLPQIGGEVKFKSCVAIHVIAQTMTIQPHSGTVIYSVKDDAVLFIRISKLSGQIEILSVNALST